MATISALTFEFVPPSPKQVRILTWWKDNSVVKNSGGIIADGAIRSGKTLSMSMSFVVWAMETFDGKQFAMSGKTIESFRRNVLNDLRKMLVANGYEVQERRGENMIVVKAGTVSNSFYIFGGRDERSQDLIQGITLAGVLLDEVALMPESFVNQATGRCSVEGSKLWFNCNPASPAHYFKKEWIDKRQDKKLLHLHFTMDDNPSLSEEKKEEYRTRYSGVFFRRYILGEWATADGAIYPMFDRELHVVKEAPKIKKTWIGVDYGSSNPTVFLLLGEGADHRIYVLKEYYHKSGSGENGTEQAKTDVQYSKEMKKLVDESKRYGVMVPEGIYVDPSAKHFVVQLKEDEVGRIRSADNSVLDGIGLVSNLIGHDYFRVMNTCKHTLDELAGYAWDTKAAERGEDKPIKANDHCMDALRYAIMGDKRYWQGRLNSWLQK